MAHVIGIPSGEMINCQESDKYILYVCNFAKYKEYIGGTPLKDYVFKDESRQDVIDTILDNIKNGVRIYSREHGFGYVDGKYQNGFILKFEESPRGIYVSKEDILFGDKISFVER